MTDESAPLPKTVNYDFLKSTGFRVVHADGAFLGANGYGALTITFFAERLAIPKRVVHRVNSDGSLGDEILDERVVRDAIVRDTEVAVTMNLDAAKRLKTALDDIVKKIDEIQQGKGGQK
jgi:hypothetical protein